MSLFNFGPKVTKRAALGKTVAAHQLVPMERINRNVNYLTDAELIEFSGQRMVFDVEVYRNFFYVAFMHVDTGKVVTFECSPACQLWKTKFSWVMWNYCLIGFNSKEYDIPMCLLALAGWEPSVLKEVSDRIIKDGHNIRDILEEYRIEVPMYNHIDLREVAPLKASLKTYGGRLHSPRMQDLPYSPDIELDAEQAENTRLYCINDLDNTKILYLELLPQIQLREKMTAEYGVDLRSKSDAQIAEAVIVKELERITGSRPKRPSIPVGTVFKYQAPSYMQFQTPLLQQALQTVANADFVINEKGSPVLPTEIKALRIQIGESVYRMGIGGLHSSEEEAAHETEEFGSTSQHTEIRADAGHYLIDRDVASYYPRIILNQKLSPTHLGQAFLGVYNSIVERRLAAKKAKDNVTADSLKITINGSFGKLGSKWSALYAPDLMLQVTLSGQLSLLLLIELLEISGFTVVSANTDGIVTKCPKHKYGEMLAIFEHWEKLTGFETEETRYAALYSRDVNNYIALKLKYDKEKGWLDELDGYKGKGAYSNPWEKKGNNVFKLHKNPTGTIIIEAVVAMLMHDTPPLQTIQQCADISKFCFVRNVKGGAHKNGILLGKVIRWYYSNEESGVINYVLTGNKVPQSEGAKPMMDLPTGFPSDVDYERYASEAEKILYDIGFLKRQTTQRLF